MPGCLYIMITGTISIIWIPFVYGIHVNTVFLLFLQWLNFKNIQSNVVNFVYFLLFINELYIILLRFIELILYTHTQKCLWNYFVYLFAVTLGCSFSRSLCFIYTGLIQYLNLPNFNSPDMCCFLCLISTSNYLIR